MKIRYESDGEPWTVYRLADGTEVKIKVVLVSVKRRDGEYQLDGSPTYDLDMQSIVHVDAPDHLRLHVNHTGGAVQ